MRTEFMQLVSERYKRHKTQAGGLLLHVVDIGHLALTYAHISFLGGTEISTSFSLNRATNALKNALMNQRNRSK